jgi:hypothetical protein
MDEKNENDEMGEEEKIAKKFNEVDEKKLQ